MGNKVMKANELMVGDWVSYHGIANKVAPADFYQKKWIDEIKPIPLTPEILKKNGFERFEDNYDYYNDDENLYIIFHPKSSNYTNGAYDYIDVEKGCVGINEMPIEFVHEFQHVLRLCGIKKEIIL